MSALLESKSLYLDRLPPLCCFAPPWLHVSVKILLWVAKEVGSQVAIGEVKIIVWNPSRAPLLAAMTRRHHNALRAPRRRSPQLRGIRGAKEVPRNPLLRTESNLLLVIPSLS